MKYILLIISYYSLIISPVISQTSSGKNLTKVSKKQNAKPRILSYNELAMHSFKGEKIYDNFSFNFGPRFKEITKESLQNVSSITDFFSSEEITRIETLKAISISFVNQESQSDHVLKSSNGRLTKEQLHLLQTSNYSDNFAVRLDFLEKNEHNGELQKAKLNPYWTIVPEKQATYINGSESLKAYLRNKTLEERKGVNPDHLRPAILYFTVTKNGKLKNMHLSNPSGNLEIDAKLVKLLENLPADWNAAENTAGEKVNQEMVLFYGMSGC